MYLLVAVVSGLVISAAVIMILSKLRAIKKSKGITAKLLVNGN